MPQQHILPVLYDLSVTIGGEIKLKSLLTRTLQRLLYHTSYSAGFVCLDVPPCHRAGELLNVEISAAVGDFELIAQIDRPRQLSCDLLRGCAGQAVQQTTLLQQLGITRSAYQTFFRLPLDSNGVIVLLSIEPPETPFKLDQVLQPVLTQLAKAIVLCRTHDAQQQAAKEAHDQLAHTLHQAEAQFKTLMDISPMGVCLSCDGIIEDCNDTFLKLFAYDRAEQLRGQPLTTCIAPAERSKAQELIRLRALGQAPEGTLEMTGARRDGSEFAFMASSRRVLTDQGPRTFSFIIDLTKQKRNERQLQSVNAMLRQVLETAPLRIFWKDQDSRFLGCNQAFARDAGFASPDELVGKFDSDMSWCEQAEMYRADDLLVMQRKPCGSILKSPKPPRTGKPSGCAPRKCRSRTLLVKTLVCWVFMTTLPRKSVRKSKFTNWRTTTRSPVCPTARCCRTAYTRRWR